VNAVCIISRCSEWRRRMERHGYQHSSRVSIARNAHVQLHNVKICRRVAGGGGGGATRRLHSAELC